MRSGPLLVVIAALMGGVLMWAGVDAPRPGEKPQIIDERAVGAQQRLTGARLEGVLFAAHLDAWVRYELSTLPHDDVLEALRLMADGEDLSGSEAFQTAWRERAQALQPDDD